MSERGVPRRRNVLECPFLRFPLKGHGPRLGHGTMMTDDKLQRFADGSGLARHQLEETMRPGWKGLHHVEPEVLILQLSSDRLGEPHQHAGSQFSRPPQHVALYGEAV